MKAMARGNIRRKGLVSMEARNAKNGGKIIAPQPKTTNS